MGFKVKGAGCRVQGAGCRVQGADVLAWMSADSSLRSGMMATHAVSSTFFSCTVEYDP